MVVKSLPRRRIDNDWLTLIWLEGSALATQSNPRATDKKDVVGIWLGDVLQPYKYLFDEEKRLLEGKLELMKYWPAKKAIWRAHVQGTKVLATLLESNALSLDV